MKLKDLAEIIVPMRDKPKHFVEENGIPWCKIDDIEGIFLSSSKAGLLVNQETIDIMHLKVLPKGTVLCAVTGASIGKYAITTEQLITNQTFAGIVCNEGLYNWYLFYYLKLYTTALKNHSVGCAQEYITRETLENIDLGVIPSFEEQKRIVYLLECLDKKINTNNAIISELESMAKDIYDYWFVQFDFPDENGKPYKSSGGKMVWNEELKREIPEGWSNCTLEKLVNIVRGVTYEEGDTVDRPDKDHIMLLRANNIANEKINLDKVTFVSKDRVSAQQILIPGDILICMSSGSKEHVGKTAELPFDEKMTFGAFCSKIRCNDDIFRPFVNRTIKSNLFNAWVKQKALGTNINNLTNEIISSMPIVYPTKQIISRFHTLLCPIISKIYSVAKESRELTSLRDFLLPLLMNGQVKIGDMEA